jgi:hypothetical protein
MRDLTRGSIPGHLLETTRFIPVTMLFQTATIVIDIVLAPILIFGWLTHRPLGVAGAALASFIAIAIPRSGSRAGTASSCAGSGC